MKTLYNIFLYGLLKKWIIIFLLSIFGMTLWCYVDKLENQTEWVQAISLFGFMLYLIPPFCIFFFNGYFSKNIKWLINQNFNRKDLIKFFFASQCTRLLLFFIIVIAQIFIFSLIEDFIKDDPQKKYI